MDKSGIRVGCPAEKKVIVPVEVTDLYAPSSENQKSVIIFETIHADGQMPLSSFVVCLDVKITDTWIHD